MLKVQPEKSLDRRIREEFETVGGGMSTAAFAEHCIEAGVWTDEEIEAFTLRSAQSEVRRALKKPDVFGLPFAGKTTESDEETGAPVWQQRTFWTYDDYAMNIHDLIAQRDTLHHEAHHLASECNAKFGKAPSIHEPGAGKIGIAS